MLTKKSVPGDHCLVSLCIPHDAKQSSHGFFYPHLTLMTLIFKHTDVNFQVTDQGKEMWSYTRGGMGGLGGRGEICVSLYAIVEKRVCTNRNPLWLFCAN